MLDAHSDEVALLLPRVAALRSADVDDDPDPDPDPDDEASGIDTDRLELRAEQVTEHLGDYAPPARVIEQCCAALSAGRHLLLVGPPGTGKTELAGILAEAARSDGYCAGLLTTTASADWTTFDTIGGYALDRKGELRFRPGVFPRALAEDRWLLVDELNRADVDKAFGELMTVLSGKGTTTSYEDDRGRSISIGPEPEATYRVRPAFRVIATMNTWDKTSLFRMSAALQRRFATVHVGLPGPQAYAALLEKEANRLPPLEPALIALVVDLFTPTALLRHRAIGPAVPLDMLRYLRQRHDSPRGSHGLAEALASSLLSQLEGMGHHDAQAVVELLDARLQGVVAPAAWDELRARLAELFPSLRSL